MYIFFKKINKYIYDHQMQTLTNITKTQSKNQQQNTQLNNSRHKITNNINKKPSRYLY
jgi:hypothetical protein